VQLSSYPQKDTQLKIQAAPLSDDATQQHLKLLHLLTLQAYFSITDQLCPSLLSPLTFTLHFIIHTIFFHSVILYPYHKHDAHITATHMLQHNDHIIQSCGEYSTTATSQRDTRTCQLSCLLLMKSASTHAVWESQFLALQEKCNRCLKRMQDDINSIHTGHTTSAAL